MANKLSSIVSMATLALAFTGAAHADGDAAAGEQLFKKCKICHSLEAGKKMVGPSLAGMIGRKAGASEGFKYSTAMAAADFVWDDANLDKWLEKPKELVPGTKMIFPGMPKEDDRENLIAYLKQFSN